jgi:phenylacetic acid degradation operon negative regulatory protein
LLSRGVGVAGNIEAVFIFDFSESIRHHRRDFAACWIDARGDKRMRNAFPKGKTHAVDRWAQRFLQNDPPRAKSVIVTIFGDSIAPHGSVVWLGGLIELLAPFGVNDRLVRTSVFRLVREGWLDAVRHGRRSKYQLSAWGSRRFELAHQKIYALPRPDWDGRWTVAIAPQSTMTAAHRTTLQKELIWEGFAMISPGVFWRPSTDTDALEEILHRFDGQAFVCYAQDQELLPSRPLRDLASLGWQLGPVIKSYRNFIRMFGDLPNILSSDGIASEQFFVVRTLLIHAFRRVTLHDPLLPAELLPKDWPGAEAYDLCQQIYRLTYRGAEQHLLATIRKEDPGAPEAAEYFYQRFRGLS